jgi:hypothetical protein
MASQDAQDHWMTAWIRLEDLKNIVSARLPAITLYLDRQNHTADQAHLVEGSREEAYWLAGFASALAQLGTMAQNGVPAPVLHDYQTPLGKHFKKA